MLVIVLEGGTNCFEGGAERLAVIVLCRGLHIHHDSEDELCCHGLEPKRLYLGVFCFQHLDFGADPFAEVELPLLDLNERVKDTGRSLQWKSWP